jgi:broad specificity phosphatase PhoE
MANLVTRILLVRHGQSEWNLSGRWQGQADPPLTDLGRVQARAAAHNVGHVDVIWSSDLQRAALTAAIIAEELGIGPVVADVDLRERDVGEWRGLTRAEINERYPGYLTPPDVRSDGGNQPRPPGWEPDESVLARATRALIRLHHEAPGGNVLVVGHGGVIYTIERALAAVGPRLGNLEGRRLDLVSPTDGGATTSPGMRLPDFAYPGERLALLPQDEVTVPDQL